MRTLIASVAAAALLGITAAAHATTLNGTYNLLDTSVNDSVGTSSITGTITLTNNEVTGADLVWNNVNFGDPNYVDILSSSVSGDEGIAVVNDGQGDSLHLFFLLTPDAQGDITVCDLSNPCGVKSDESFIEGNGSGRRFFLDGSYLAPTPEPSSLVLLGTGVLGVAGAIRRRIRKA